MPASLGVKQWTAAARYQMFHIYQSRSEMVVYSIKYSRDVTRNILINLVMPQYQKRLLTGGIAKLSHYTTALLAICMAIKFVHYKYFNLQVCMSALRIFEL